VKYYQQIDETDCGPACIAMVTSHYGLYTTIGRIRELGKTDFVGTNLAGMALAAEKLGFTASPMRGVPNDATLNSKIIFPFIAHVKIPYAENTVYDHYVVVHKITKSRVFIWDPDSSRKKHSVSRADFFKIWSGYVLFLSPSVNFTPHKGSGGIFLRFLPLFLPYRKDLVIVSVSSLLLIVFGILTSYYYKYITDEVIISKALFTLTAFSIGAILVTVTQSVVESLRGILINYFAFKVELRLDFSYISHVLKLPLHFFDSRKTGEILSRLTDISKIREMLSSTVLSLLLDCVLIVVAGPVLFKINSVLFAVSTINIVLISVIILLFSKTFRKQYGKLRREEAEVNSSLVEAISGAYTIKSLNAEKVVHEIYEKNQMKATWTNWKTSRLSIIQRFLAGLINGITTIVVFWVGSSGIIKDTFSFGTLLSFNSLLGYYTGPLFRMINVQPQIQEASTAAERVSEILEMEVEQPENTKFLRPSEFYGDIAFDHVFFKYGMRPPVFKDLSFHIAKGRWVAFVGPSGCGKTTLIKLLLKFYEPEEGTVSVDGHNIKDVDATFLRERIAYVPQEIYIFAGTIAENISLHRQNSSMEEIIAAAEKAGLSEFIDSLPARYNTKLSERGATLSGGERQRLALARALLGSPGMIILDEATSNLDAVSERLIHDVIEKLRGSITAIIVAHRLTTVKNCDIIYVMDKGDIIEFGNHRELLQKNGLYKTMWEKTAT
jgi:ATP-binding cassette subfamily B protein